MHCSFTKTANNISTWDGAGTPCCELTNQKCKLGCIVDSIKINERSNVDFKSVKLTVGSYRSLYKCQTVASGRELFY